MAICVITFDRPLSSGSRISWTQEGPTAANGFVLGLPIPAEYSPTNSGHAICICGYDTKGFIFKNSWGDDWGDKGYGWVSYDFLSAADETGDLKHTGSPSVILDRPGKRIEQDDLEDTHKGLLILSQMLREVKNRK